MPEQPEREKTIFTDDELREMWRAVSGPLAELTGPLIRFGNACARRLLQPRSGVLNIPIWKCKTCGCLWRDNLDESVSLFDAQQKSCASCEPLPVREACEIHWLSVVAPSAAAPVGASLRGDDKLLPEWLELQAATMRLIQTNERLSKHERNEMALSASVMEKAAIALREALASSPTPPPREMLGYARILELCDEFGVTETDILKHRLEDWERWNCELRSGKDRPHADTE